ncbi:hypothetical protein ACRRTK_015210 [Alexandromys fortis]
MLQRSVFFSRIPSGPPLKARAFEDHCWPLKDSLLLTQAKFSRRAQESHLTSSLSSLMLI